MSRLVPDPLHAETPVVAPPSKDMGSQKMDIAGVATTTKDEDDSNSSSTSTEPSDVFSSGSSNAKRQWPADKAGAWQRYGSSESATSTAISSNNSSTNLDSKTVLRPPPTLFLSCKKRLSDGTLKLSPPSVLAADLKTEAVSSPLHKPHQHSRSSEAQPKKRHGRPAKATPNIDNRAAIPRRASFISRFRPTDVRPRSSIPARIPAAVFASQCIKAAYSSRLDPYALHPGEHELLANLLMNQEVTIYLNIRNAILRIWCQNPSCAVTAEEAAGCAKDSRFFGLAEVAYKWLVRNGYINFGCVEVPQLPDVTGNRSKDAARKTIVVIGAGVSGLTAARQLEGLIAQSAEKWTDMDELPPRVVVLEGRKRIGGRVYSKPLRSQEPGSLPNNLRNTAEMGAMIVTGFEHGNPLDIVIRGQLGLHYHLMTDELTIYDCDGRPVNERQDMLNTDLYTDISDRAGGFRATPHKPETLRGDEDLVKRCRDPVTSGFDAFQIEPMFDPLDTTKKPSLKRGRRRNAPPGTEKLTGRSRVIEESGATNAAARAAKDMGWQLKEGVSKQQSISLATIANASAYPTLGAVMDDAIGQYQKLINIKPRDMRLLNWHHANLEYANAAPVSALSLSGHDQDTGNEFEGAHSEIIGGYTQLPRGLMHLPTKLDVRFDRVVESIHYDDGSSEDGEPLSTKIVMTDGEVIEADHVITTTPLGVLKTGMIDFDPPLPPWKRGAIDRMGFGLLNKVILLYDEPFWDNSRDMFGLLNEPDEINSLNAAHYAQNRGRFYLIWNATKTSGRPMLIALMAGKAAHEAESTNSESLMQEVTGRLRKVFTHTIVPAPREVIVTRWKRDPFTRGTYSYVGPKTRPSDYDLMADPIGNLHFAGEATCGTHPATVHGAFLSGLRVAADVMNAMVGSINLPEPLVDPVPPKSTLATPSTVQAAPYTLTTVHATAPRATQKSQASSALTSMGMVVKQEQEDMTKVSTPGYSMQPMSTVPRNSVCAGDSSFWVQSTSTGSSYQPAVEGYVLAELGERPPKPPRRGVNPFLVYTKDKWEECKAACSTETNTAGRDLIRQTLGKWWRQAPDSVKQPYIAQSQTAQQQADDVRKEWEQKAMQWDLDAARLRKEYGEKHSAAAVTVGPEGGMISGVDEMNYVGVSKRKTNVSNNVVLDHA